MDIKYIIIILVWSVIILLILNQEKKNIKNLFEKIFQQKSNIEFTGNKNVRGKSGSIEYELDVILQNAQTVENSDEVICITLKEIENDFNEDIRKKELIEMPTIDAEADMYNELIAQYSKNNLSVDELDKNDKQVKEFISNQVKNENEISQTTFTKEAITDELREKLEFIDKNLDEHILKKRKKRKGKKESDITIAQTKIKFDPVAYQKQIEKEYIEQMKENKIETENNNT